jgi:hypothetical protein
VTVSYGFLKDAHTYTHTHTLPGLLKDCFLQNFADVDLWDCRNLTHNPHSEYRCTQIYSCTTGVCRSQWPRDLRRKSSAARLLVLWVRIPPGAWMIVCCECCVLLGRGLCDGLIARLEESYRLWRVVVYDQETSKTKRLKPATEL